MPKFLPVFTIFYGFGSLLFVSSESLENQNLAAEFGLEPCGFYEKPGAICAAAH